MGQKFCLHLFKARQLDLHCTLGAEDTVIPPVPKFSRFEQKYLKNRDEAYPAHCKMLTPHTFYSIFNPTVLEY